MDKAVFSSDQLPPGLTDQQRFLAWRELYNQRLLRADIVANEGRFNACMTLVRTKDVMLARASATLRLFESGGQRAAASDEGRIGLLINTSTNRNHSVHRGREEWLAPGGAMLLSRVDAARFSTRQASTDWVIIDLPHEAVLRAAPHAEDLVGSPLAASSEPLRIVAGYAGLILEHGAFSDPRLGAHASQTLIDLVSLTAGAAKDAAAIAGERGLRAARIDAIVHAIAGGFLDPAFSVVAVARKLRMSERYVQDLLHSTGAGFSERVLELRLLHAAGLLARASSSGRKVSDIAFSSGFNDPSYFHRCFRRRFGMTPVAARNA